MSKREKDEPGNRQEKSDRLIFTMPPEMAKNVDAYSRHHHIPRSELGRMAMTLFLEHNKEMLDKALKAQGRTKD